MIFDYVLHIFSFKDKPVCDYGNPRNDETWFCVKPPSGTCTKITFIAYGGPGRGSEVNFSDICSENGCDIKKLTTINVLPFADEKIANLKLEKCKVQFQQARSSTLDNITGYFKDGQWQSRLCRNEVKSFSSLERCFDNKIIYLVGDSTIRQFFYLFAPKMNLVIDGPDNSVIWQQPKVAYNRRYQSYNTNIYYRAHGPPLQNPGPPETRPYISDTINDLPVGGENVYVIFNIGAHIIHYNPNIFLHRIKGIKKAILKHHEKFPETKFVLRGLNVLKHEFQWLLYRHEMLLRSVFSEMKNVVFLNFWDITTVWPLKDFHPEDTPLHQQALIMLGYVCS